MDALTKWQPQQTVLESDAADRKTPMHFKIRGCSKVGTSRFQFTFASQVNWGEELLTAIQHRILKSLYVLGSGVPGQAWLNTPLIF